MDEGTAPLDALRARRESLQRSLAGAIEARTEAERATADAVASTGTPPSNWPSRSAKLDSDVHSLKLGVDRMEVDVRAELGRVNLSVAKLEQRRPALVITRDALYVARTGLLMGASAVAAKQAPIPTTFAPALADMEERLATTVSQLDSLDLEIATAKAPLLRYERDRILASQHAEIARAKAA